MKPGLSLRVSQHLALTPQLQQSIRLLQLSTLELSQEIEQMIQDNPFLEQEAQELGYEEQIALERSQRDDEKLRNEELESNLDATDFIASRADSMPPTGSNDAENESFSASSDETAPATEPTDWDGDSVQNATDDTSHDLEMGMDAGTRSASAAQGEGDYDPTENNATSATLQEHLHRQALSLRLSQEDRAALYMLIESLNDDGYLEDDFESLAQSLGASTLEDVEELIARFSIALKWLQNLEPVGVGARNLAECLQLQLRARPDFADDEVVQAATLILEHPLELLAKRDVKRLAQLTGNSQDVIKAAIALIARLEPKPARQFAQVERNIVIPDVIVRAEKRRGQVIFVAQLNPEVMPRLHVNDLYANALKGSKKTEAVQGLQTRLQEARWFIKNVQQRFDTILRVSQAIIERQSSFFKHGAVAMRPLVLREIADEIGMHESTISRVTTAKYMSTPYGTFELKYFFGSALTTETGGIASSTAVRELIKQFIDAESKAKPLSDNAIADMLKEQGIECARRTVAKYREALRIPVTSLRKTL
ncbi:RNA polymerase factor sigma-54 [Variovorax sp. PCZ-1]|uniref:RNA polymerase factor sigma-54 n=1 Tax=Variovorax sp. PCZ-1 TaxID=2835533 RepID=UPI001BCD2773|nr:RNA polymerase factor sigma-54 [Variovorax sp. PCZ-1]MBS7806049.1 RNA polymerase factor sigma-54 [Variovorax sp. PCZ-1]